MNDDELERKPGALSAVPDAQADLAALGAFVDGELPPDARAAMAARLLDDETAARRVGDYRAQKAALQALSAAGEEAAPLAWRVLRRRDPWWRRTGIAAAWAVVGAGFTVAAGSLVPQVAPQLASAWSPHRAGVESHDNTLLASDTESFARRADVAYAVYSPEVRHPVEVGAADEAHLVAWLSKRLGRPLTIPPLGEYGYTLVGGRLLPGGSGPAAQFMYQNGAGERLTLYVSASGRERDAVQLLRDGGRRTFYWSTDRMGYALSGPASEGRLRKIAYDVCGDLGGNAAQW